MQTREKILGLSLGGIVIAWLGLPYLESTFLTPLRALEARATALTADKDRLFSQQLDLARKDADMKKWRGQSLPPDPLNAQRLYQEWLTNLAQISGFEIQKITLDRRVADGDTCVTIPVTIDAKAKLRELAQFFERFESADLLQRISRCDVVSPANEGDPELTITLTAEGLSLQSAPARARLFPQTELFETVKKDATAITVVSNKSFPKELPFCVRVGNEFLNVTAISGNTWTVQRGVEKTFAEEHETGSAVEQFPLRTDPALAGAAASIWNTSLFTKPAPFVEYKPQLSNKTPPAAIRGRTWNWKLDVTGWNPAFGTPNFEVLSAPGGFELNERTGTLQWKVTSQAELGTHPVELLVWGTNGRDAGFTTTVNVRVREPNQPPQLAAQSPLKFFIGRESAVKLAANDPDGEGKPLKFLLEQGPAGMTVDTQSGELRWKPAEELAPQQLEIKVKATDGDELPESVSATIPITLEEDSARFTYLTGSVRRTSGKEEAWIYDRATNRTTIVHAGETFQVADYELTVESIGPTFMIVKRGDQTYRWNFEQPLTQMTPNAGT
ncbi:cadherin repeat domain-containing protein [Planctomicrobium piriforme]|uniref:Uncharacterized protein n=1 Tax=Planctomicrobium piriforme TaxID=1576369 RepID=A0A1I3IKE2_9PLAN|nr:cadherin repeat domain-containing protein [Planctomicrobium piriforme]SFI48339.1 hypothetical protein SAMN05421753_109159 [Planctomicrobium piriforme]